MYPDGSGEAPTGDLLQMLGLRPPPAAPTAPAPNRRTAAPPSFRLREPWEQPGRVAEPDDDFDDYDDDDGPDDYADDEDDDYDYDYDDEDADDLGRAWQGRGASSRGMTRGSARASGGPPLGSYESRQAALGRTKRRSKVRFVMPVLALAVVGAGAVKLLGVLPGAQSAGQSGGQHASAPAGGTPSPSIAPPATAGTTALTRFPGYPGQQGRDNGQLAVNSVAAANGTWLAVGSADGYPAIWRHGPGTSWSLAANAANGVLAGRPGNQTLIAVTNGAAGWLGVGDVVSGAQQHAVVVTSADGQTWRAADGSPAFSGAGLYTYGAAAGRIDYVIVGEQVTGKTATAATWWSAGLGTWNRGSGGGSDGSGKPSEMFAVTVTPERFIAVGAVGSQPAVWSSPNGQRWTATDLPLPTGATKAALRQVVDSGQKVVATGNAETPAGTVAFAEVSSDAGTTWREIPLTAPGPQVTVSALAASSSGFVAVGQSGQPSTASAVVWTSVDGSDWKPAREVAGPADDKVRVIASLASAGGTVAGIGAATTKAGVSPVLYTAPAP
jgi:hypothetical protein